MKYLGNGASEAEKDWDLDPEGYISPKRRTKSNIADKIQNGRQEIQIGRYAKILLKFSQIR